MLVSFAPNLDVVSRHGSGIYLRMWPLGEGNFALCSPIGSEPQGRRLRLSGEQEECHCLEVSEKAFSNF